MSLHQPSVLVFLITTLAMASLALCIMFIQCIPVYYWATLWFYLNRSPQKLTYRLFLPVRVVIAVACHLCPSIIVILTHYDSVWYLPYEMALNAVHNMRCSWVEQGIELFGLELDFGLDWQDLTVSCGKTNTWPHLLDYDNPALVLLNRNPRWTFHIKARPGHTRCVDLFAHDGKHEVILGPCSCLKRQMTETVSLYCDCGQR